MDLPTSKEYDTFVYERDFVLGNSKELIDELNAGSEDEEEDISSSGHYTSHKETIDESTFTQSNIKRGPDLLVKQEAPKYSFGDLKVKKEYNTEEEIRQRPYKSARRDDDEDLDIRDRYSPKTETREQSGSIFAVRKKYFSKSNSPVTNRHGSPYTRSPISTTIAFTTPAEFHSSPSSTGSELYHLPHKEIANDSLERNVSCLNITKDGTKRELPTPARESYSPVRQSPPPRQRYASPIRTPENIPTSSVIKNEISQSPSYRSEIPTNHRNVSPRNNDSPPVYRVDSPVHKNDLIPLRSNINNNNSNGHVHQSQSQLPPQPPQPVKRENEFIPPASIKKVNRNYNDVEHHDPFQIPNDSYIPNIPRPGESVEVNKNKYSILRLVGEGASGKVFQVYSQTHKDIFALKWVLIKKEEDRQAILNEIKLLMSLKAESPIVKLYDHCNTPKVIYMIMEYGDVSFQQIIANQASKNWDLTFIKYYWLQMLNAVNTIHENNIVHSDLKPANFVIVKGYLKLIDFGIAKRVSDDTTNIQRDVPVGTVNYMAPEALTDINEGRDEGKLTKQGRPSDIWSLGCILYQMVYGKPPFYHLTLHQRVVHILNKNYFIKFEPTTVHNNATITVPPILINILRGCLDRKPSLRSPMFELLNHPFVNT